MTAPHSISSGSDKPVPLADHDEIGRKVLGLPWAIQSGVVTIAAHCTVIKDKYPAGDASDLAGCISQDLLDLANALSAILRTPALPSGEVDVEAVRETIANEWGSHLCYRHPDGMRQCDPPKHCRCNDIAYAVVSQHALASSPAPQIAGDATEPEDLVQLLHRVRNGSIDAERDIIEMFNARWKELATALSPQPQPPAPPFSRWADIIESASLTISPKGSKELDALAAEVRAGGAAQPPLTRRPVAFRVPRTDQAAGGETLSQTEWQLFNDEESARQAADELSVDYQGLYARDGSMVPSTNRSPPDIQASHNSGERDPSVMPDWTGGETNSCGRCIRCLDAGFTATAEDPIPPSRKRMVVCQHCGNKRCPCATYHRNPCTDSNWAGQPGSIFGPALPSTQSGGAAK